nr:YbaK/EbsC family protein [Rhizobium sp. Q54]
MFWIIHQSRTKNSRKFAAQHCVRRMPRAGDFQVAVPVKSPYSLDMSLSSVQEFFAARAPDIEVLVTEASSATVPLAAAAHGVAPEQIAKTICIRVKDMVALIVMAGTSRLDNRKFKDRFGTKPRMVAPEEVLEMTSHPVGGVCPFGLRTPLPVLCDVSLRIFDIVIPAAGAPNAAVRINPLRLAELTEAEWVDLCQDQESAVAAQ